MTLVPFKRYYKRACRVVFRPLLGAAGFGPDMVVENLDDDGVDIDFDVARTNRPEPDKATIRLWNLSEDDRKKIAEGFREGGSLDVLLFAGYERRTQLVYFGHATQVLASKRIGQDIVTEVTAGDGANGYREGRLEQAFAPGQGVEQLLRAAALAMSLNVPAAALASLQKAILEKAAPGLLTDGYVFSGPARVLLDRISRSMGLRWWVRNGELVLVPQKAVTTDLAVVLTPDNGLLAGPEAVDGDRVRVVSLLNPQVFPGRQVFVANSPDEVPTDGTIPVDADGVKVGPLPYRVESCRYRGDLAGDAWDVEATMRLADI